MHWLSLKQISGNLITYLQAFAHKTSLIRNYNVTHWVPSKLCEVQNVAKG